MRVAVAGLNWGRVHLSAYRELGCELTAVACRDPQKCRIIADQYGIRGMYSSVSDMPENVADIISVAVPAKSHFDVLMQAERFGGFIVCEKPVLGFEGTGEQYERLSDNIFFNYAYPFLEDIDVFYQKLGEIRHLRSIAVECLYNLSLTQPFTSEEFFYETVSHPVSLIVHKFPDIISAQRSAADTITAKTLSGIEIRIVCRYEGSFSGIRHRVKASGDDELELSGEYVTGSNWHYKPLLFNGTQVTGEHYPAADPWYTANKNSLGNLVRYFRGGQSLEETLGNGAFDLKKAMIVENILNSLKNTCPQDPGMMNAF